MDLDGSMRFAIDVNVDSVPTKRSLWEASTRRIAKEGAAGVVRASVWLFVLETLDKCI